MSRGKWNKKDDLKDSCETNPRVSYPVVRLSAQPVCGFSVTSALHILWGQSRSLCSRGCKGSICLLFWSWSSFPINICQSSEVSPRQSEHVSLCGSEHPVGLRRPPVNEGRPLGISHHTNTSVLSPDAESPSPRALPRSLKYLSSSSGFLLRCFRKTLSVVCGGACFQSQNWGGIFVSSRPAYSAYWPWASQGYMVRPSLSQKDKTKTHKARKKHHLSLLEMFFQERIANFLFLSFIYFCLSLH